MKARQGQRLNLLPNTSDTALVGGGTTQAWLQVYLPGVGWVDFDPTNSYADARSTRTAWETFNERRGVCRDFTHLAVTFCRCMNIPACYCTGYLGDIGVPPPYGPMDFSAWFEAYLDGAWHVFDPRNNAPRIGRVLMARGRDAVDVPISDTFGPKTLKGLTVWTDEEDPAPDSRA
jgi:transglutaminase-like putative cysteine protease